MPADAPLPPLLLVLHDFLPDAVAGTELYVLRLARELLPSRPVFLFYAQTCPEKAHGTLEHTWVEGLPVFRVVQNHPYRPLAQLRIDALIEQRFEAVLDLIRPGLVHFHHLNHLSLSLPLLTHRRGLPSVMTLHDYALLCPSGGQLIHHPDGQWCLSPASDGHSPPAASRADTQPPGPSPARCTPCYAAFCHRSGPLESLALSLSPRLPLEPGWPFKLYRRLPPPAQAAVKQLNQALPRGRSSSSTDAALRHQTVQALFQTVDLFIAPSQDLARRFTASGLPGSRLRRLPNPRPATDIQPLPPMEPLRLLFVGTLAPHKGVHRVLEAVARFKSDAVTLQICGDPEAFPNYTWPLRQRSGANVRWLGPQAPDRIPELLAQSHALVLGSTWPENAPLTVLEALAAGRPVVAPHLGGIPEQLIHGQNGLLFDPNAPDGLFQALQSLLDPALLETLHAGACVPDARQGLKTHRLTLERWYAGLSRLGAERSPVPAQPLYRPLASPLQTGSCKVSVIIPTFNGGPLLQEVLTAVQEQHTRWPFELLLLDSSSTDESVTGLKPQPLPTLREGESLSDPWPGVRCFQLPSKDFQHGRTRNLAARLARGTFLVYLVQDATPLGAHWLQTLVEGLASTDAVGGYARQVARDDADPVQRTRIARWTPPGDSPGLQHLSGRQWQSLEPDERLSLARFDNVCSIVRREVLLSHPFPERPFGEDLAWGVGRIQAGQTLAYLPMATVLHSHNRPFRENFLRARLEHQGLRELLELRTVPSEAALLRALLSLPAHLHPRAFSHKAFWRELAELLGQAAAARA